jgi:glutathione S-transferase
MQEQPKMQQQDNHRMRLHLFPASARALGIVALKNYVGLDCELQPVDLGRGDQLTP